MRERKYHKLKHSMLVPPAYLDKPIIERVKIIYCHECNLASQKFFLGNIIAKIKCREELGKKHKRNGKKCAGLTNCDFLKGESCELICDRFLPRVAQ